MPMGESAFLLARGDCRSERQAQKGSPVIMRRSDVAARTLLLAAGAFTAAALSAQSGAPALTAEAMKPIAFRSLGPSLTTGRISDVAVDPKNPSVWYVAAASGNLWKTENRGNTWTAIFDDYGSYSLGAVDGRPEGLERRLARHRREQQPAERRLRRRHLQVHRCGQDLEADGARELRAHPEHRHRPAQLERGLRHARSGRCGRRAAIAACTRPPTAVRRGRPVLSISADTGVTEVVDGSEESRHSLRGGLSAPPRGRAADWRRAGERLVQVHQWRPDVDEADEGTADRRDRPHRARRSTGAIPRTLYALVTAQLGQGGFFRSDDAGATWTRIGRATGGGRGGRGGAAGGTPPAACAAPMRIRRAGSESGEAVRRCAAQGGRGGASDDCYRGGDPGYYNEIYVDAHDPETIWSLQTNVDRSSDGGKTWSQVADARRARRSPRHRVRSRRQEPHHPRRTTAASTRPTTA